MSQSGSLYLSLGVHGVRMGLAEITMITGKWSLVVIVLGVIRILRWMCLILLYVDL